MSSISVANMPRPPRTVTFTFRPGWACFQRMRAICCGKAAPLGGGNSPVLAPTRPSALTGHGARLQRLAGAEHGGRADHQDAQRPASFSAVSTCGSSTVLAVILDGASHGSAARADRLGTSIRLTNAAKTQETVNAHLTCKRYQGATRPASGAVLSAKSLHPAPSKSGSSRSLQTRTPEHREMGNDAHHPSCVRADPRCYRRPQQNPRPIRILARPA